MKAIVTKYQGPTDFRPLRILAYDEDGNRIAVTFEKTSESGSYEEEHRNAALAFARRMGLTGTLVGGSTGGPYYAWVWLQTLDVNPRLVGVAYAGTSNIARATATATATATASKSKSKSEEINDIMDMLDGREPRPRS